MSQSRQPIIHPSYIIMVLVLAGITTLFLGFSGAYLYNRFTVGLTPIHLPWLFYLNTFILLASSWTLIQAKKQYLIDDTEKYKLFLIITLGLTILFLLAQVVAWYQLFAQNISLTSGNMAAYMYLISGLHLAHVIAGIPFLSYFIYIAIKKMKSPVSVLVYFSDPDKKRNLDLLTWYWHFLDGLWIYLVLFFLINYLF